MLMARVNPYPGVHELAAAWMPFAFGLLWVAIGAAQWKMYCAGSVCMR